MKISDRCALKTEVNKSTTADVTRRALLAASAMLLLPPGARANNVADAAGRAIKIPETVTRVFPAGPPAAILLYTLTPDLLLGWPRANRTEECAFMLREVCTRPRSAASRAAAAPPISNPFWRSIPISSSMSDRQRQPSLRSPRAGTDRNSLCAARRPLRGDPVHLSPARRGRG